MVDEWQERKPGLQESSIRVRVYDNPYAAKQLTQAFGVGPWDDRFGPEAGHLKRMFIGPELTELEEEETEAGITVQPWKH
jgi:hypothetical protein